MHRGAQLTLHEGERLLTPLFVKLQARLDEPRGEGRVRVTHVGDSHIIADFWTGAMRERWQASFGDGGRGYVLPGKGWRSFSQKHIAHRTEGEWDVKSIKRGREGGWFGPGGCFFKSDQPTNSLEVFTRASQPSSSFNRLRVFSLASPTSGAFTLSVDETPYGRYSTQRGYTHLLSHSFELNDAPHSVRLSPAQAGEAVTLLGFSLERSQGGLIYDAIGLNGAQAKQQLKNTQSALHASLKALNSDLIILSYGINELFDHSWSAASYERELRATVTALRRAAPHSECLLTGPFAALLKGRPHPELDAVYLAQRQVAAELKCAFWDARAAMGDDLRPWQRARLAQRDGIHLTVRGYQRVATLFEESVALSLERWRAAQAGAQPLEGELNPQATPRLTSE